MTGAKGSAIPDEESVEEYRVLLHSIRLAGRKPMDYRAAYDEIRLAAEETLCAWPEAKAAVLYGSRARGNWKSDSDWDVAFILHGDGNLIGTVPNDIPFCPRNVIKHNYVNDITLPEGLVERKACCICHPAHGITRNGKLLAGKWDRPQMNGQPSMEAETYGRFLHIAVFETDTAIRAMVRASRPDPYLEFNIRFQADYFVSFAAKAASFLVRAALGRRGIDASQSHEIAEQAAWARQGGHPGLADDLASMDIRIREDRHAGLSGTDPDGLARGTRRLPIVIDLLGKEVSMPAVGFLDPEENAGLEKLMSRYAANWAATLRSSVESDGRTTLPEGDELLKPLLDLRTELLPVLDRLAETADKSAVNRVGI